MANNPKVPPAIARSLPGASQIERLLSLPEAKDLRVPQSYATCLERLIPHFLFRAELRALFEDSERSEDQTLKLHQAFQEYPDDYARFLNMVRETREKEGVDLTDEAAIRAHGLEATRLFIFAVALSQSVSGKAFQWEPDGIKPKVSPEKMLLNTLRVQSAYSGREVMLTFAAGLAFDTLVLVARKESTAPRATTDFISNLVKQGIKTARIGVAVAKKVKDLRLSNYVFSACVLGGLGDAVQAICNPEFMRFQARVTKDDLPGAARNLCEERLFGLSSGILGGLLCDFLPVFQPIADVIRYQRNPVVCQAVSPDVWNLAATCSLASYIQSRPLELTEFDGDAIAERWLRTEMKDLKISPEAVYAAVLSIKS